MPYFVVRTLKRLSYITSKTFSFILFHYDCRGPTKNLNLTQLLAKSQCNIIQQCTDHSNMCKCTFLVDYSKPQYAGVAKTSLDSQKSWRSDSIFLQTCNDNEKVWEFSPLPHPEGGMNILSVRNFIAIVHLIVVETITKKHKCEVQKKSQGIKRQDCNILHSLPLPISLTIATFIYNIHILT